MNHLIGNILCTAITVLCNSVQQLQPSMLWNTGISSQKGSAKDTVQMAEVKILRGMDIKLGCLFYIRMCQLLSTSYIQNMYTYRFLICPTTKEQSMNTSYCKKPGLHVMQSHLLHRKGLSQYYTESTVRAIIVIVLFTCV